MSKSEKIEPGTRYFIVFYNATKGRKQVHGMLRCTTSADEYINKNRLLKAIKDQDKKISAVVLTNIIELSLKEFKEFSA